MTQWTPVWKLTINGVDYTSKVIANVTHTAGRKDIYQQPASSYIQIEIVDLGTLAYDFEINDGLTLQVKNSSGTYVTVFGGNITDITRQINNSGRVQNSFVYRIIALGYLAKLTRAITNGVLSKDFDGNQILSVLGAALYGSWNEVPAGETWSGFDPAVKWQDAYKTGIGEVDTPGDYELTARSSNPTTAYNLISELANSALGYVYEDNQGRISYAKSSHRQIYLNANGYTTISAGNAIAPGMASITRASDVRNEITLSYKNNATVNVLDTASQALYGSLASTISTSLENAADATSQADFYLKIRAYPQQNLSNITFALQNPNLSDAARNSLLEIFMGMPLNITNIPTNIITDGRYQGFVEGWSFNTTYNGLYLTVFLSPTAYSIQSDRWTTTNQTKQWSGVSGTLTWNNATIVA